MNGKMVVSKPLYVTLAQRKEDRRARLQVCVGAIIYYLPILKKTAPVGSKRKTFDGWMLTKN
jgi:hypothetical protein